MRKLLIAALMFTSTGGMAQNVEIGSEAFGEAVREFLMENPEVIFEAVDKYQAEQEQAAAEATQSALKNNLGEIYDESQSVILGNPDGKKIIVKFSDYNCGYCGKAHSELDNLIAEDPEIRVVIKQFPILSQGSFEASQVVMTMNQNQGQEAARELHNALFENDGPWAREQVMDLAESLGHDRAALEAALTADSDNVLGALAKNEALGAKLKIQGTPAFVVGDELIGGYVPAENMKQILDQIYN